MRYQISVDCEKNANYAVEGPEVFGYDFFVEEDNDTDAAEKRDMIVKIIQEYKQPVIGSTVGLVNDSAQVKLYSLESVRETVKRGYRNS